MRKEILHLPSVKLGNCITKCSTGAHGKRKIFHDLVDLGFHGKERHISWLGFMILDDMVR